MYRWFGRAVPLTTASLMKGVHATWTPQKTLFLWSHEGATEFDLQQFSAKLPKRQLVARNLALPDDVGVVSRTRIRGLEVSVRELIPLLVLITGDEVRTDSLWCFVLACKLAVELAARKRVIPQVNGGGSEWRALLTRAKDRQRFERIVEALPPAGRCLPTRERGRGSIELTRSTVVVSDFVDAVVDDLYRRGAHPGPARGWSLELAESLRAEEREFQPRDARHHAVPMMLDRWARDSDTIQLRLGLKLQLPQSIQEKFGLTLWVHPTGHPEQSVPVGEAWSAGETLEIAGQSYGHPAHAAVRGVARVSRLHLPLRQCLEGNRPKAIEWSPEQTWTFLSEGVPGLRDAGFEIELPEEFESEGARRIRVQMRVGAPVDGDGTPNLREALKFRWEVTLGERILEGDEFEGLLQNRLPIVALDNSWVLLDPVELARLPEGLGSGGELKPADALRAVLTGEHQGIPVVMDERLSMVLGALRDPPEVPIPKGLKGTLRPYQARGLDWLSTLGDLGLGCCLADDMGLGKTIQLIAHLLRRRERGIQGTTLVVCPTSVLGNWEREIRRFGPELVVQRYHGAERNIGQADHADVLLTTYGLMVRDLEVLREVEFDVLCLDEAQSIKNPESQRARAACALTARHRVALSGTPIENRLDEMWSLMSFLIPGLLGGRSAFRRNIALPVERFGDTEAAERLRLGVSPFLLRRLKTDPTIIDDLPDKIERVDYTPMTSEQALLYQKVVDEAMSYISSSKDIARRGRVLAMLTALKQVCNHPAHYLGERDGALPGRSGKLERLTDLLDTLFELGERALIFTQYREMGSLLKRHIADLYGYEVPFLHGATSTQKREEIVDHFQHHPEASPVLIISLRAGGTGLNLTRASHVVHYDRWWNPAVEDQATDRAYRIGQSQNVQVHKMVCQGTLEERIDLLLEEKRSLAESVVGTGERWVTELDDESLKALVTLDSDAVVED